MLLRRRPRLPRSLSPQISWGSYEYVQPRATRYFCVPAIETKGPETSVPKRGDMQSAMAYFLHSCPKFGSSLASVSFREGLARQISVVSAAKRLFVKGFPTQQNVLEACRRPTRRDSLAVAMPVLDHRPAHSEFRHILSTDQAITLDRELGRSGFRRGTALDKLYASRETCVRIRGVKVSSPTMRCTRPIKLRHVRPGATLESGWNHPKRISCSLSSPTGDGDKANFRERLIFGV